MFDDVWRLIFLFAHTSSGSLYIWICMRFVLAIRVSPGNATESSGLVKATMPMWSQSGFRFVGGISSEHIQTISSERTKPYIYIIYIYMLFCIYIYIVYTYIYILVYIIYVLYYCFSQYLGQTSDNSPCFPCGSQVCPTCHVSSLINSKACAMPDLGGSLYRWLILANPNLKRMMTGGTPMT